MKRNGHKTDVVPFVIHGIYYAVEENCDGSELSRMVVPTVWAEQYGTRDDHIRLSNRVYRPAPVFGWTFTDFVAYGQHERLLASRWVLGPHSVYYVNEDGYANGGAADIAVCADSKIDLDKWLEIFRDHVSPELVPAENDIVHQWFMK